MIRSCIQSIQASYQLGLENKVFDAELYNIAKSPKHAVKQTTKNPNLSTDAWINSSNSASVKRMTKPTREPGQYLVIQASHNLLKLQGLDIRCDIYRVQGNMDLKSNEIADKLAETKSRGEPDCTGRTHLNFPLGTKNERRISHSRKKALANPKTRQKLPSNTSNTHPRPS